MRRERPVLAHALVAHCLEGAELVEGMLRNTLVILGEGDFLHQDATCRVADDARDGRGLVQALALHQQFERAEAAPAGRHLEHAGLDALGIQHRPDVQRLDQAASGDGLGQVLDRDPALIRRTFDWLSTNLLRGMSREDDRVIF